MNSNLSNRAGFENLYGDYSLDYPAVNGFGDIESKYTYTKFFGIFMIIIGAISLVAHKYKSEDDKKNKKKSNSTKILLWIASIFLILGTGFFAYFFYAYFYLYLPQYAKFYGELPEEARLLLKKID